MWFLVWVQLIQGTMIVSQLGAYETHDDCIYDMHEAEIVVNKPWEGMICIQDAGDYDANEV